MNEQERNAILFPTVPALDDKDHTIAMLKYVIDRMWDKTWDFAYDIAMDKDVDDKYRDRAKEFTQGTALLPDGVETEDLAKYANENDWNTIKGYLDDMHIGDCTAVAATCMRCYAENFYEHSTCPPNKSVGAEAFYSLPELTDSET